MVYINDTPIGAAFQAPPLVQRLQALFDKIPDGDLLRALKPYYAGRRGYTIAVLWRTYIAMAYMGIPSFAALIRQLQDNPNLREACGIASIEGAPSAFAYSRFMRKLQKGKYVVMVKNILRSLTRECYATFPNFGKSTALDSTDLKAWSNGRRNPPTDPDAGWVVKLDTAGRRKYVWGYRLHVLADTTYELPIAVSLSAGNVNDVRYAPRVLVEARVTTQKFHPDYIACDAGYSSDRFRTLIRRQYSAMPVVKANPVHKKAARGESEEFKRAYGTRTSVERLFGRLKGHRRLNNITVRRKRRVAVHCLVPLIVTQAQALVHPDRPRACVR